MNEYHDPGFEAGGDLKNKFREMILSGEGLQGMEAGSQTGVGDVMYSFLVDALSIGGSQELNRVIASLTEYLDDFDPDLEDVYPQIEEARVALSTFLQEHESDG